MKINSLLVITHFTQDDHQLTSRNWKENPLLIFLNIENIEKETVTLTSTITLSDFIFPKTDQTDKSNWLDHVFDTCNMINKFSIPYY